jgi:hypothetical protein
MMGFETSAFRESPEPKLRRQQKADQIPSEPTVIDDADIEELTLNELLVEQARQKIAEYRRLGKLPPPVRASPLPEEDFYAHLPPRPVSTTPDSSWVHFDKIPKGREPELYETDDKDDQSAPPASREFQEFLGHGGWNEEIYPSVRRGLTPQEMAAPSQKSREFMPDSSDVPESGTRKKGWRERLRLPLKIEGEFVARTAPGMRLERPDPDTFIAVRGGTPVTEQTASLRPSIIDDLEEEESNPAPISFGAYLRRVLTGKPETKKPDSVRRKAA